MKSFFEKIDFDALIEKKKLTVKRTGQLLSKLTKFKGGKTKTNAKSPDR